MLSLNECSQVLNKNGRQYNEAEVKAIRSFMYKMAEMGNEIFQKMDYDKKLVISRWKDLSNSYEVVYTLVRSLRKMGVQVQATEQPIDFRSGFWNRKLAIYLWDNYGEQE